MMLKPWLGVVFRLRAAFEWPLASHSFVTIVSLACELLVCDSVRVRDQHQQGQLPFRVPEGGVGREALQGLLPGQGFPHQGHLPWALAVVCLQSVECSARQSEWLIRTASMAVQGAGPRDWIRGKAEETERKA